MLCHDLAQSWHTHTPSSPLLPRYIWLLRAAERVLFVQNWWNSSPHHICTHPLQSHVEKVTHPMNEPITSPPTDLATGSINAVIKSGGQRFVRRRLAVAFAPGGSASGDSKRGIMMSSPCRHHWHDMIGLGSTNPTDHKANFLPRLPKCLRSNAESWKLEDTWIGFADWLQFRVTISVAAI